MNQNSFDVIVVGVGGVGSAVLLHLAERGARVLGIDSFHPPHDRGSSHGQTRIIRQAYFEHPDYVPLLLRAYELWNNWSGRWGRTLLHQVGLVEIGPPNGQVIPGVRASSRHHGLAIEELSPQNAMRRFPGLSIPEDYEVVFEPTAGYLEVENCVLAMVELARRAGASLTVDEPVREWCREATIWRVETEKATYYAPKLIFAGGAWSAQLIPQIAPRVRVLRKTMHWYAAKSAAYHVSDGFPAFLVETNDGVFYGFPVIDDSGLKTAEHSGGEVVDDPSQLDRNERPEDSRRLSAFLAQWLPDAVPTPIGFAACMYTMSPDEHFLIGSLPNHDGVHFAGGLSGHGFKFTPVLGEILADLSLDGQTEHPIEFLSPTRWGGPS